VVIVNTSESPQQIRKRLGLEGSRARVFTVDATGIALETLKRDIPATLMIGAIIRATALVDLENAVHVVEEKLGAKLRGEIVKANLKALRQAYENVQEG
jgi:pyruvate ferredoxin oxidoreductase gamma subunit